MSDDILSKVLGKTPVVKYDEEVKDFGNRPKLVTPIIALNEFLGGGIPVGSVVEVAGPPKGGKTGFTYQTLAGFQKQYPNGLAMLFESESSSDSTRMSEAFGVDINRLYIYPGVTLDSGFDAICNIAKNMSEIKKKDRVPIFILWDSLTNSATDAQVESGNPNGGGMAEAARLIKSELKILMKNLADVDMTVFLISQVSSKIGGYVGGFTTSGGMGLKHAVHLQLWVNEGKPAKDGDLFYTTNSSSLSVKKSKISPLIDDLEVLIDIKEGGRIDEALSFIGFLFNRLHALDQVKSGGYYGIADWVYERYPQYRTYFETTGLYKTDGSSRKGLRWSAMSDTIWSDPILLTIFKIIWIDELSTHYKLQAKICKPHRDELVAAVKSIENPVEETESESKNDSIVDGESDEE